MTTPSMSAITPCSSSTVSTTGSYRDNAFEILQNIENQFIRAIEEINNKDGEYGISYFNHCVHHKGPIPTGEEFKEVTTFSVSIDLRSKLDNNNPFRAAEKGLLYLEEITPFIGNRGELKQLALNGNIPDFEGVYSYWLEELSNEITFFENNSQQILLTKDKINEQFTRAIREAQQYATDNDFWPISIGSMTTEVPQGAMFEPLYSHAVIKVSELSGHQMLTCIGRITLVANREAFKLIVLDNNSFDFDQVFPRSLEELKEIINTGNAYVDNSYYGIVSRNCTLL